MSGFTRTPKVLSGAIIGFDIMNPLASVVIFQYNPETLTRSLQAQTTGGEGDRAESVRFSGAPTETISLEILLDATDALEKGDSNAQTMGVHPQLAGLEMLLYPKSLSVITNTALLASGTIEVMPPAAPLTLFVWGLKRVLPVQITDLSITEARYDVNLNPIRAEVSVDMRVLTYSDLSVTHPGYALYLTHQVVKETMATIGSLGSVGSVIGGDVSLF